MSRVLAIDLDGTLLDENNNIIGGDATIQKFKHLHERGVNLVINTGRLDHDIDYISKKYDLPIDVRISQNGAVVCQDDTLKAALLDKNEALHFYKEIIKTDLRVELNTVSNRYWHSMRSPDFPKEFFDSSRVESDFSDIISFQPCVLFLLIGDNEAIDSARRFVTKNYKNLVAVKTSKTSLEVLVKGISKGKSLAEAYSSSDIFAIGDSENDHSMFEYAKHAYYINKNNHSKAEKVDTIVDALSAIIKIIDNEC